MARSGDRTRRALLAALPLSVALLNAEDADGLLYDRVHRKLNNNLSLRIRDLKVTVVDAVVTIEGIVRSEKLKKRATKVASVKGVKNVVNKLRVGTYAKSARIDVSAIGPTRKTCRGSPPVPSAGMPTATSARAGSGIPPP